MLDISLKYVDPLPDVHTQALDIYWNWHISNIMMILLSHLPELVCHDRFSRNAVEIPRTFFALHYLV